MGEVKGFLKYTRKDFDKRPPSERIAHYSDFKIKMTEDELKNQAARCMDCGVPFCQYGCPINNIIPDWNDLVYREQWQDAIDRLHKTNNFPEFTGIVCPAPCENACCLGVTDPAVTIKNVEYTIVDKAFELGLVHPRKIKNRTGKTVAVIGSGPAGLAVADQLNKAGHTVTVFEKNEEMGGLLTFGIPDFKLEKWIVKRRVDLMAKEGVIFKSNSFVGVDIKVKEIVDNFDAIVLSGGAEDPRGLPVEGSELKGVYQSMQFLSQQNRINRGIKVDSKDIISAKGKNVIVLGGGDTGSDCVGTSNRHGAKSIKQFELLAKPPKERQIDNPWPEWANIERTSTSHEEGCERDYSIMTKKLTGENGVLKKLHAVRLEFGPKDPKTGRAVMTEIKGSEFSVDCDLLILAMGFLGPVKKGMLESFGVELDSRGNVKTNEDNMTSVDGIFSAGDMHTGQSLVVRAIADGRKCAKAINKYLSQALV